MRRTAAALGVAALIVAGCSDAAREAAERSGDPVIEAAAKAADEGSARVEITVAAQGHDDAAVTGEGVFDLDDGSEGEMALELPASAPGAAPTEVEMRIVDDDLYLRTPQVPGGEAEWQQVDPSQLGAAAAASDFANVSPTEMIRMLDDASDFDEAGTEEIRGDEATRYEGALDIVELADSADPGAATMLRQAGLDEVPAEVLVDDDGRLRQVTFTLDLRGLQPSTTPTSAGAPASPPAGDQAAVPPSITFRIELYDFGTPVDVERPDVAAQPSTTMPS